MTLIRMTRTSVLALCVLAMLFAVAPAATAQTTPDAAGAQGDFAGLVDIGGRKIYLECSGQGSPTVVLVAGVGSSARYWTDDLRAAESAADDGVPADRGHDPRVRLRPARHVRRGGRRGASSAEATPSPNRPPPMAAVTDLHALLQAARVPGPYILAGHSIGGFISRMYASTYPDEVVGMVLIDAYSEFLEPIFGPKLWPKLVKFNAPNASPCRFRAMARPRRFRTRAGDDLHAPIDGDLAAAPDAVGGACARQALRPSEGPDALAGVHLQGGSSRILLKANQAQAKLVPDARFFTAKESGHDIHQDQPALTAEAIQQVVAGVRSPDTWYSLQTCCRT